MDHRALLHVLIDRDRGLDEDGNAVDMYIYRWIDAQKIDVFLTKLVD